MSEQKIEMNTTEVKAMMDQIKSLTKTVQALTEAKAEQDENTGLVRARNVGNRTVTIMLVDGKAVIGLRNVGSPEQPVRLYEQPDPRDSKKYFLAADLIVKDLKTNEITTIEGVNFAEFIQQGERRECPILKMRGEEWSIDNGYTQKRELKGNDYKMQETELEVPLEVTGVDNYYVVDVNGTELEIFQDFVNMAKSTPRAEKAITRIIDK